jgi:hypothetical protein
MVRAPGCSASMGRTMPARSPMAAGRYSDRGVEPTETSPAGMGAASTTGERMASQGFRMGLSETRYRWRPTKVTSNRFPLSEKPKDPERNARTSQRLSRGSVKGVPAKLILRARGRLQLSERDRVDQQDGSGPRTAHGPGSHVDHGHEAEGRLGHTPREPMLQAAAFLGCNARQEGVGAFFGRGGPTEKME